MVNRKSRNILRILCSGLALLLLALPALAQADPDPNSPTPVLLTQPDSNRALSVTTNELRKANLSRVESRAYPPGKRIVLFVANIALMEGEGANAFRTAVLNRNGQVFRFPVLNIQPYAGNPSIYAITIELRDELGFWDPPTPDSDLTLVVTWRGLTSNKVRIGFGVMGGTVEGDGDIPIPLSSVTNVRKPKAGGPTQEFVGYRWSGDRMRFLEQAAFGPNPAMDERVRRVGIRTWLAEQFLAQYPSAANPYPNLPLKNADANNITSGCGMFTGEEFRVCLRDHYGMYTVQKWFFKEALYGEPQLRHRVAWALSQIWVTSGVETQQASHMIATNQILGKHSFGNYRELMKEMTLNPGMGNYLDMVRSTKNNPNENYAREVLQLFNIGLFMLNQDGTVQLDGNNEPIPTYDQNTVNNFTKVFTGWGFCETTGPTCPNRTVGAQNYKDPMLLNQTNHDVTAKTLLGYPNAVNQNIAAGLNGNTELDLALDNIFNHPNVGPFIGKILIQQMVTSNPTPAYVGRVAAAFNNNGSGVRGDLKAVIRAILLDPEARGDVKTDPNYGKLREPVQLMTNLFRSWNVRSSDNQQQSDGVVAILSTLMAQNPFNSPTVFNYYPMDYVVPGTALPGPEFNIMTTGTAIARANFANTMVFGRLNAGVDNPQGTSIDLSELQAMFAADTSGNLMLDLLNQKMLHSTMSASMRASILTSLAPITNTNTLAKAQQALYLVTTSSQYQIQR
jgi:uncharacterized protein (DUF1800 family)